MARDRERLIGAAAAALWLVGFVVLDITVSGQALVFSPLFVIAPLIASAVLPLRGTAVFAGAAIAAAVASGWWDATAGDPQQTVRITSVALVSVAAVIVAAVRVRRERRLERVAKIADVAQRTILPKLPNTTGNVAVAARYLSAAQDAFVGGDFYDFYSSQTHTRFVVGDVRGKGIAGIEQAARVIRAFRQSAAADPSLERVAQNMSAYLVPFFDYEEFVTALLVDTSHPDRLIVVSCGHPPPLLVRSDGSAQLLDGPAGLPLGLGEAYEAFTVPWGPGDRLLMYTDGLSEARDADGRFLPVAELAPLLTTHSVEEAVDAVLGALRGHVPRGNLTDDLAALLLGNVAADQRVVQARTRASHSVAPGGGTASAAGE